MKLKDLSPILFSRPGSFQSAIVYDMDTGRDLVNGCSVDYAVKTYGDHTIARITAYGDYLVLNVCGKEN